MNSTIICIYQKGLSSQKVKSVEAFSMNGGTYRACTRLCLCHLQWLHFNCTTNRVHYLLLFAALCCSIGKKPMHTLNSKSRRPANTLYILKSGSLWKYLSNELNAFIMPVVLRLLRATTISPSTMVVSAHSWSTSNPVCTANEPFRHMIRYSFGSMPRFLAWSAMGKNEKHDENKRA